MCPGAGGQKGVSGGLPGSCAPGHTGTVATGHSSTRTSPVDHPSPPALALFHSRLSPLLNTPQNPSVKAQASISRGESEDELCSVTCAPTGWGGAAHCLPRHGCPSPFSPGTCRGPPPPHLVPRVPGTGSGSPCRRSCSACPGGSFPCTSHLLAWGLLWESLCRAVEAGVAAVLQLWGCSGSRPCTWVLQTWEGGRRRRLWQVRRVHSCGWRKAHPHACLSMGLCRHRTQLF